MNTIKIYENKNGFKVLNFPYFPSEKHKFSNYIINNNVLTTDLYLGIDFLNDKHTLLGTPLSKSPHFDFMKKMHLGEDWQHSEYIDKMINGTLDERNSIISYIENDTYFLEVFNNRKEEMLREEYDPIIIYKVDSKYYIYDGKHRAALAAVLNKKIKCIIIEPINVLNSMNYMILSKLSGKTKYNKHKMIFKSIKESYEL